ncbi:unnamed protein product [Effrenium voratum]|uniref:Pentatricopeptide repeat-containing protein, chloroplastic n=1 Tax=Effrenium voratum TaxID=2562239 RepID=A0AA36MMJ1_9DINO|nr:unnamed protein product [Effrenium voratum]
MSSCEKARQWQRSLCLLAELQERRLRSSVVSYNAAISACGGRWQWAVHLLRSLLEQGLQATVVTFNAAISGCERGDQWQLALELLAEIQSRSLQRSQISFNAAISACERGEQWEWALRLLQESHSARLSDSITYNAAISACEKGQQWQCAMQLLEDLAMRRLPRSIVTFGAAISACEKGSQWQQALALLQGARSKALRGNVIVYSAAISACGRARQWQQALRLFAEVQEVNIELNVITYDAAISSCEKGDQWQLALELLADLQDQCLERTACAYNASIACAEWQHAFSLMEELQSIPLQRNVVTHGAAIRACEQGSQWQQVFPLLDRLEIARIAGDEMICTSAIGACEKGAAWQYALCLLMQFQLRRLADAVIYAAAICACAKSDRWQASVMLLVEMQHRQLPRSTATRATVISACERAGRVRCLSSMFLSMSLWLALLAGSSGAELSAHFSPPVNRSWNLWTSGRERQQLEWQELTLPPGDDGSVTGLTGGLLRLGPNKELPTHYHPESFGETYYFTRGNGHVKLGEYTRHEVRHAISPGLHVNIPARMLHGIESGRPVEQLSLRALRSKSMADLKVLWCRSWQSALDLLLDARHRSVRCAVHQTVGNLAEEARRGAEALRPFWDVAPSRRGLLARWSHALDLFFQQIQETPGTLDDYRAAIKACPRFYWTLALHMLQQMEERSLGPDRLSYREAMRTCNRGLYSYEAAIRLFRDLGAKNLDPGVEEYNELILALITGNRWLEAFNTFAEMRRGEPSPNMQSYCLVLYACADSEEADNWSKALAYWTDMRKAKLTPGFDAYDMLLLVAERSERWDWSRQLLDTLFKLDAPRTVTMFNAALNAARRGKRWELAQSLLREMSQELLLPTIVSYSFAVAACEKAQRFDVATGMLEMVDEWDAAWQICMCAKLILTIVENLGTWYHDQLSSKTRVQRKVEELVTATLEAKATAPCKALKRRVCQRARKKLAHWLTQEEFEKAVVLLKEGPELERTPTVTATEMPEAPLAQAPAQPAFTQPVCMRVPVIYLPVPVPCLRIPTEFQAKEHKASPDTPRAMWNLQRCEVRAPKKDMSYEVDMDTPRCQYNFTGRSEQVDMDTPRSQYNFTGNYEQVDMDTPRSQYNFTGNYEQVDMDTPRCQYNCTGRSGQDSEDEDSDEESTCDDLAFVRQVTLPVHRTFIQFNVCQHSHRRSKSI